VADFQLTHLPETDPSMTCLEALNYFQQGRSHMLLVSEAPGENDGALGVVSLEDVIEEMIGEE
jgi:metal transporter CNNM